MDLQISSSHHAIGPLTGLLALLDGAALPIDLRIQGFRFRVLGGFGFRICNPPAV